jgi:hypothetical protein
MTALDRIRAEQQAAGDYIRAARAYPEWLGDIEGAKRGAEDWLMEEALEAEAEEPARPVGGAVVEMRRIG